MPTGLSRLRVKNYRSLADVELPLAPINVFFGPNGAGKSTLLDTVWFIRGCALRSVPLASADRDHGIGLLFDGAEEGSSIALGLQTDRVEYELTLQFSAGRIEPFAGERLYSRVLDRVLIDRRPGATKADFCHVSFDYKMYPIELREPEKLSLPRYLDFTSSEEATELDRVLHYVRLYHSRSFDLYGLKEHGSPSGYETWVWPRGENLWSVLRNLEGRRRLDDRYETIMRFMAACFPHSFDGIVIEPTSPTTLYARFLEKGRSREILASGVSDGHLQMLILLTALFSDGRDRYSMLLIDEPETSLHPWALAVLAKAIQHAAGSWGKQILLATHSPVLISQFDPEETLTIESREGRANLARLSEIPGIQDLLEQYATGTLYMSELIAGQSQPESPSPQVGGIAR